MTWRRFCVLLHGLGPESLWRLSRRAQAQDAKRVITDGEEAERFTASLAKRR